MKTENSRIERLAQILYREAYPKWFEIAAIAKEPWYRVAKTAIEQIDDWHKPQDKMPRLGIPIEFIYSADDDVFRRLGECYFDGSIIVLGDYSDATWPPEDITCWRYVTPAPDYAGERDE